MNYNSTLLGVYKEFELIHNISVTIPTGMTMDREEKIIVMSQAK